MQLVTLRKWEQHPLTEQSGDQPRHCRCESGKTAFRTLEFPSGITFGTAVAKTVFATWLLLAAWLQSKAKATVRITIRPRNFGLIVMIKAQ